MGYYVKKLRKPYDFKVLVDAYVYSTKDDFVHPDFAHYYSTLVQALEAEFGVRFSPDTLSGEKSALWMLFESTVRSLLRISTPWDRFIEASLIVSALEGSGEAGKAAEQASNEIIRLTQASEVAHRDMLYALFTAIFGVQTRVVTSEDIARRGVDDSQEPDIQDYYDYF
jgi:hypothetical protein